MSYIIFESFFVAIAGCCMILVPLRNWGYADSRMTCDVVKEEGKQPMLIWRGVDCDY